MFDTNIFRQVKTGNFISKAHVYLKVSNHQFNQSKVVLFKENSSFHFVVLREILNGMEKLKLIIEEEYIRINLSPNLMDLVVF